MYKERVRCLESSIQSSLHHTSQFLSTTEPHLDTRLYQLPSQRHTPNNSNMRSSTIAAILTGLGALTHAAPTADGTAIKPRQFEAQITFQGAPPDAAFFTLSVATDGSVFSICKYSHCVPDRWMMHL